MEDAPLISKSMLTSSEFTEITCRFWDLVIKKFENNTTGSLGVDGNIKLEQLIENKSGFIKKASFSLGGGHLRIH